MRHAAILPVLATAEVRAAAHQLRALSERLVTLAEALPLPPEEIRKHVYGAASQEVYRLFPVLELYVDLRELAGSQLLELAGALEEVGRRPIPHEVEDD